MMRGQSSKQGWDDWSVSAIAARLQLVLMYYECRCNGFAIDVAYCRRLLLPLLHLLLLRLLLLVLVGLLVLECQCHCDALLLLLLR
jgi:hypothetical protein